MNTNHTDTGDRRPQDAELFGPAASEQKQKEFKTADALYAVLLLVFGYLFIKWVFFQPEQIGLGAALLASAACALSVIRLRLHGIRLCLADWIRWGLVLVFSLALVASDSVFIKLLTGGYGFVLLTYTVFCAAGNREEERLGDMLIFDLVKSTLVMPFSAFGDLFRALSVNLRRSSAGRKLLMAAGGIAAAAVPTFAVLLLLIRADGAFSNLLDSLFSDALSELPINLVYLTFGIPVAMYFFGMLYANMTHQNRDTMTREENTRTLASLRCAPVIGMCAAMIPLLAVYLLFFFSQSAYFLSAFSGIRPEGITYAEYARRGFFELCGVCLINTAVTLIAGIFTKREGDQPPAAIRICTGALAVSSLALIAIALSKMFMYIGAYGLTLMRIYTTWFMVMLAILFVLLVIRQFRQSFPLMRVGAAVCAVMVFILVFGDADRLTAGYNVYRYTSGQAADVDIQMMYDLSDAALEYVLPLTEDENESVALRATQYTEWKRAELAEPQAFAAFNLTSARARRILQQYDSGS